MKKTISLFKAWVFFALFGTLLFASCKKENTSIEPIANTPTEVAASVETSSRDVEAEVLYDDVFNITASVGTAEAGEDLGLGSNVSGIDELGAINLNGRRCYTITVIPNIPGVFPKTVTVNFGDGCLGRDGKFRKGKIVSIYTNRMLVPGAKVSTTFLNYYVDSLKIEGTHITENTSNNNVQGWKVAVLQGKITNTNTDKWIKWNSLKNILQIGGNGTPHFPLDDVYKITGGANGSNSVGHVWSSIIVEPLIKRFTCQWIVKGTVNLVRNSRQALLDYGTGECDNQAILYINGIGHPITL